MNNAFDEYLAGWRSMPWHRRAFHRAWWMLSTIWCAILCRPGPGERLLLRALSQEIGKRDE